MVKKSVKGALVKGYLEKVDIEVFEYLYNEFRKLLGGSSGIYALYKGNTLYYVGISEHLLWRVWRHAVYEKGKWDNVSFFVIEKHKYCKDIETVFLRIQKPKGNASRGQFKGHWELQDKLVKIRDELKNISKKI
jgi:hypothetical protein